MRAPEEILSRLGTANKAFDDSGDLLATLDQVESNGGWYGTVTSRSALICDLPQRAWWRVQLDDPTALAFAGSRLVVGDASGKLHVIPSPRASSATGGGSARQGLAEPDWRADPSRVAGTVNRGKRALRAAGLPAVLLLAGLAAGARA
jgi:hypothetical protein